MFLPMRVLKGLPFAFWIAASRNAYEKDKRDSQEVYKYLAHESCEQRLKTASFYNECLAIRCP